MIFFILLNRGRGVAVNILPCQGKDRGFESRRSRIGCANQTQPFLLPRTILTTPQLEFSHTLVYDMTLYCKSEFQELL